MKDLKNLTYLGTTRFDGPLSHQLQLVEVPIISPAECRGDYGPGSLTDTMLCAGHIGQDTCQVGGFEIKL